MKKIKKIFILLTIILFAFACKKSDSTTPAPKLTPIPTNANFKEIKVSLSTHKLASFSIIRNSKYLVVFESGLGDNHTVWYNKNVALQISKTNDVVLYDRAGHGDSEDGPTPRDINRLQGELDSIINYFSNGRKVILVGHSLGGLIIRDCAIKHPNQIAALFFIDPSHEAYSHPTQQDEDNIYNSMSSYFGANSGEALDAREWIEDLQYMTTLPNLPDVPVTVLTSMIVDATRTIADRQAWYNAHESLGNGVTNFTHIGVPNSGHYIMIDQPKIVIDNLNMLLSKLP